MVTTYLGGSITFTCTKADIFMEIAWQTDLLPLLSLYFQRSNKINTTLTGVVHYLEFNNTSVWCKSRYPDNPGQVYFSNEGKILIQGMTCTIFYAFCFISN